MDEASPFAPFKNVRPANAIPTSVFSKATHVSIQISATNTPVEGCAIATNFLAVDMEICKRYAIARVPSVLLILSTYYDQRLKYEVLYDM